MKHILAGLRVADLDLSENLVYGRGGKKVGLGLPSCFSLPPEKGLKNSNGSLKLISQSTRDLLILLDIPGSRLYQSKIRYLHSISCETNVGRPTGCRP